MCRSFRLQASFAALLLAVAAMLAPVLAHAQMIPILDGREIQARATYQGTSEELEDRPLVPFAPFTASVGPFVEKFEPCEDTPEDMCSVGYCQSAAFQISEFFSDRLHLSGGTSAEWQGDPSGNYGFLSVARFRFRVDTAFVYTLNANVNPGDWPSLGLMGGSVALYGPSFHVRYHYLDSGALADTGRLGPGEYVIEGVSSGGASLANLEGAIYFAQLTVTAVADSLIGGCQPLDQTVSCGGTAFFSVCPVVAPGITYQWRRNLTPLTDDGRIAGASSGTLTINNACDADTGYYDVVLSDGTIIEPSRLAHLGIWTVAAVEAEAGGPARLFSIEAMGPNPFQGATSFRYTAARAQRGSITIYNVAGAKIRSLSEGVLAGSGTVTWDGDTDKGTRAPAGIYFLRAEAGSIRESRKVVLVR